MVDGSPSINLTSAATIILEDSQILTQLTITLVNAQDPISSENLSISSSLPGGISLQVSDDGRVIVLSGVASLDAYASALSGVVYENAKMSNIIENQPDFTPR